MRGQEFFSTTKKLAILDKPGLAKFAEIHKDDPILVGMAINEKNRRDALEQNRIAQSAPMGQQPTVMDAKLAEIQSQVPQQMASQGIAGLPAPTMEAMGQRASSGGIMRYAGGGFTNVQIIEMVRKEAARRGINPDTAERILRAENAKLDPKESPKTSSAFGLFQTTEATWKSLGGDPKKKDDVEEQIRVGLNLIQDNDTKLGEALGRQPTPAESYTTHVLGLGTGLKVINADPGANVEEIVGKEVANANPNLFRDKKGNPLTVAQATDILGKKVGYSPTKVEGVERAPMVTAEADPLGTVEMPEERARTGLVKPKEFFKEAGKGLLDIPTAYIPGLPGDIEGLGRLGLRAAGADVSEKTVLPGSEQFRGAFAKAYPELFGESADPRLRNARTLTSVAGSGITRLPGAAVRGLTKAPAPGLRTLEADLAAARQEAAALKDAATPRLPAPAAVGPQPMDPAARLAAIEEKKRLAANAARAELKEPPIPPKPAAPRPSAEAAEQAAESAARAKRIARDEAVKQLPGAEQKVTMLESAAQKAEEARRAAAAVAPGGAKQGLKDLARAATVGAQATMGEGEGGIRGLARGAAGAAAAEPDFEYGDPNVLAFARGEEPDPEYGDPGVLASYRQAGKQVVDSLPKEEKKGLAEMLGGIDDDFYLSMGIGFLSGSNLQEAASIGGQLYMKRKDAKLAREAKAKETESEIEERKARTAESKARTKALEGGDKMRQQALELAQKELEKDIELMGRIGPEADAIRNRKLEEAYYRNLRYLQNSPVGLQSTIPGFDISQWGPLPPPK